MKEYPDYISIKRSPANTPKSIVKKGEVHYGTFDKPFSRINLIDAKRAFSFNAPKWIKKMRLAEWEAFEINMDEGILICAVYKMFPVSFSTFWWYDKLEKKASQWQNIKLVNRAHVAKQLIDDDSYLKTKSSEFRIHNRFMEGFASGKGYSENKKCGIIKIDMKLERISPLANGVMPLGRIKKTNEFCNPLYSEKDFFKAKGSITVNGNKYISNDSTVGIIDDHKGFYPYNAHYDWLTTMGEYNIDGKMQYLAFNLTRNQSVNQDDFNENVLWLEGKSYPLPPVTFEYENYSKSKGTCYIKDQYGQVDIKYEIQEASCILVNAGIFKVDYSLSFGKIYGYIKDHEGRKYILDNMDGVGEDKTTRL